MLQFYQWYGNYTYNQSFNNSELSKKLDYKDNKYEMLSPPSFPLELRQNKILRAIESTNLCPICLKQKKNECVLTVSGFVFCYPCIFKYVKKHKKCPLTNYQCNIRNIARIYDSGK